MKCSHGATWWLVAFISVTLASAASAQLTLTILHSFTAGNDGEQPKASLVQGTDGALYGTTFMGGTNRAGTVFKVQPDGSGNTPLYQFPRNAENPFGLANPSGLIQAMDGGLYGTDSSGGRAGNGSVFRLNPDGTDFTILHDFDHTGGRGYSPSAAVVQGTNGFLYGTTEAGGTFGGGTVFEVGTNGVGFLERYSFGAPFDAQGPKAPLIQGVDGVLYGTTVAGGASAIGGASGYGTIFKINPDGTGEAVLHSFLPTDGDGQRPYGALVQGSDGTLYGVTSEGGSTAHGGSSGGGTIFKINPDGSGYSILHSFDPALPEGKYPWPGLVIGNDGALYGTTQYGGTNNVGVLFRFDPDGSGYTVLYTFGSSPTDGRYPISPLVRAKDGGLFGTAPFGGDMNYGIIFRLAPAPAVITSIRSTSTKLIKLSLTSAPSFNYRIEVSPDQQNWTALTNVYNASGVMEVTDPNAPMSSHGFYRAAWVP